jgi:hypothetical protein
MGNVSDPQFGQVTGTQLAIDGQVEERQITRLLSKLKSYSDSPDISDSERGFLTDKLSLVPRLMAVSRNSVHGSSSTLREDKGGSVTMAGGGYQTHSCLSAKA